MELKLKSKEKILGEFITSKTLYTGPLLYEIYPGRRVIVTNKRLALFQKILWFDFRIVSLWFGKPVGDEKRYFIQNVKLGKTDLFGDCIEVKIMYATYKLCVNESKKYFGLIKKAMK